MANYLVPGTYATVDLAIAAAVTAADQAGIVIVSAGTYNMGINFTQWGGGRTAPLTVRASDPSNPPVFDGSGLGDIGQAVRASSANVLGATERPTLENLVFANWAAQANGLVYNSSGPTMRIRNCTFRDSLGEGIRFLRGPSALDVSVVDSCLFLNLGGGAIHVTNSEYAQIINCAISNCTGQPIASSGGNSVCYDTSVWVNSNGIVSVIQCGTVSGYVVEIASGKSATRAINSTTRSYGVRYGTFSGAEIGTDGGGNVTGNPGFLSPSTGDLRWANGASACQGAGTSIAGVTDDYFGTARPQGSVEDAGYFELVESTTVTGVTVLSSTSIRLDLAAPMSTDSTWTDAGNFAITPTGGAVAVVVLAATGTTDPSSAITLITTEHTDGGTYNVEWSGVTHVDDGDDFYIGAGSEPTVDTVTMTAALTVRVVFDEAMKNDAELTDAANYVLDSGAVVSTVTRINSTTVDLTLAGRIRAESDTLTVSGPTDLAGNPVVVEPVDFDVPYLSLVSLTVGPDRDTIAVLFNLPPDSGADAPSDWTVAPIGPAADVGVTDVTTGDGTTYTLAVSPRMSIGSTYRVTALNAANGAGPIG